MQSIHHDASSLRLHCLFSSTLQVLSYSYPYPPALCNHAEMHIEPLFSNPNPVYAYSSYPSPPSLASSDTSSFTFSDDDYPFTMGANTNVNVDGVGVLNYQRAIDVARNTEGDLDPTVSAYLEDALNDIWRRISAQPDSYIMTKDEFAIFNFYRRRFEDNDIAEHAVARYWSHTYEAQALSS